MKKLPTTLKGPLLLEPVVHGDARGSFHESFREDRLTELGVDEDWVQDNQSRSSRGVLRGMHFQLGRGQAKLVRCARGAILDVAVDIRRGSPQFGKWTGAELTEENRHMLWVPPGFAHGFVVTGESASSCETTHGRRAAPATPSPRSLTTRPRKTTVRRYRVRRVAVPRSSIRAASAIVIRIISRTTAPSPARPMGEVPPAAGPKSRLARHARRRSPSGIESNKFSIESTPIWRNISARSSGELGM